MKKVVFYLSLVAIMAYLIFNSILQTLNSLN